MRLDCTEINKKLEKLNTFDSEWDLINATQDALVISLKQLKVAHVALNKISRRIEAGDLDEWSLSALKQIADEAMSIKGVK